MAIGSTVYCDGSCAWIEVKRNPAHYDCSYQQDRELIVHTLEDNDYDKSCGASSLKGATRS